MPPCPESAQITPPPPVAAAVAWDTADAAMAPSTDASTWQMCQARLPNLEARAGAQWHARSASRSIPAPRATAGPALGGAARGTATPHSLPAARRR